MRAGGTPRGTPELGASAGDLGAPLRPGPWLPRLIKGTGGTAAARKHQDPGRREPGTEAPSGRPRGALPAPARHARFTCALPAGRPLGRTRAAPSDVAAVPGAAGAAAGRKARLGPAPLPAGPRRGHTSGEGRRAGAGVPGRERRWARAGAGLSPRADHRLSPPSGPRGDALPRAQKALVQSIEALSCPSPPVVASPPRRDLDPRRFPSLQPPADQVLSGAGPQLSPSASPRRWHPPRGVGLQVGPDKYRTRFNK